MRPASFGARRISVKTPYYGSVALFNEDAFDSGGGGLLLLISIGVGASFLLSRWFRRAGGLVALGLACLWA